MSQGTVGFAVAAAVAVATAVVQPVTAQTGAAARPAPTGPGLVVPVPAPERVVVQEDSFTSALGGRQQLDVYSPAGRAGPLPVVVFANGSGPALRNWRGYVEWARLVTERGLAGVLYEGTPFDAQKPLAENVRTSIANLDSVLAALARRGDALGVEGTNVVIWAGSAQTYTGTPVALDGARPAVKGYVLYYGAGTTVQPRADVPVFVARAGLDAPELNRSLDSLTQQLTDAGVPLTLVNYAAGQHAFDIADSTAMSARVIAQTLDFMASVTDPGLQRAIVESVPEARAAAAFAARQWAEAVRMYEELATSRPNSRSVAWRRGLAHLENGSPAAALHAFARARELGQGGARDLGVPAARAGIRAGDTRKAAEWVAWALRSFPAIRQNIAADPELAPLLDHPLVRDTAR